MTAKHYYRDVSGTLIEQTDYIIRESWTTRENAEEGSVGSSSITVVDTAMALDYTGHRRWLIIEDESELDDDVLYSGYTGAQEITRGEDGETFEPLGRVWSIELYDVNTVLSRRVLRSGKRPAETDVERIQWLLGSAELSPWLENITDYVSTASAVDMDKVDYTGQMTNAVFDDCAQQSGKNWFVRYINNGVDRELCAFYGNYTWDSPLTLSNDPADWDDAALVDGTSLVWPIQMDGKLRRDPSRVFSGGYLEYEKGRVYRRRAATETAFALGHRDMIVPAANVKTKAKAIARVNRALLDASTQEERISGTVRLPKGKATMLKPGMRVGYKAVHQPGYEEVVLCRVLDATPHPVAAGAYYDIAYTLIGPGNIASPSCSAALASMVTSTNGGLESGGNTASVASTITADGYVVALLLGYNGNTPNAENMGNPSGYTVLDNQADFSRSTWSFAYKAVSAGTATATATFTRGFNNVGCWIGAQSYFPWAGVTVVQEKMSAANQAYETFDSPVTAGNTVIMLAVTGGTGTITPGGLGVGPTTGWSEMFSEVGISNDIQAAAYARCVQTGDGQVYGYGVTNPNLQQNGCYLVELATA